MFGGECALRENRGRTWRGGQLKFRSVELTERKIDQGAFESCYGYRGERSDFWKSVGRFHPPSD